MGGKRSWEAGVSARRRALLVSLAGSGWLIGCQGGPGDGANRPERPPDGNADAPRPGKPCPPDSATLRDKFMGMLLLGAYGDALGGPHEFHEVEPRSGQKDGSNGHIGDPAKVARLPPLSEFKRPMPSPWGLWLLSDAADTRGTVTDDTSYRVTILHRWLCELAEGEAVPTEAAFFEWLRTQSRLPRPAEGWRRQRHAQIEAWLCMLEDAERLKREPVGFRERECNVFFRKNQPVVFGPFMYLELAAIHACCPEREVFDRFAGFSCLDQGYGRYVSGWLAALMSCAVCETDKSRDFGAWFCAAGERLLTAALGDPAQRAVVKRAFDISKPIGKASTALDEKAFLEKLRLEVYRKLKPNGGLGNFDPALFVGQMAAAVGYAGGDLRKALRVLAVGPGDSDTVPSFLGSIMGGWCGERRLRALDAGFAADLDAVRDWLKNNYGVDLGAIAECLATLARKHGCCRGLR